LDILAAFQAYLIYAITAFFLPTSNPSVKTPLVDHTTMSNLQEFAYQLSLSGLLCTAETTHSRPSWESWIIASTKRRALYAMYLFDNVFNALARVPTYIAEELANLPVPASKSLWEATEREAWEREYDQHLAAWEGGELRISELWFAPEKDSPEHRDRVDRWVESVDEFGMMLFAVCAHIHGC
jgi:Fungal specific transcription factor domain